MGICANLVSCFYMMERNNNNLHNPTTEHYICLMQRLNIAYITLEQIENALE